MPEAIPLRFLNGDRELFGLLQLANPAHARGHAVLLCNPFGQEAIRASRLYRVMSDRLQTAGYDVLRFDYYGSGDSAGEDEQFDLDGAVRDAVCAADLLCHRALPQRLSLVGLRLGASIVALASAQTAHPVDHLVLFEPVNDGPRYLATLYAANARILAEMFASRWLVEPELRRFNLPDSQAEALGFATTEAFRSQLSRRLSNDAPWPGRARHVQLLAAKGTDYAAWRHSAGTTRWRETPSGSDIDWATNSALNNAIVPRPWLDTLLATLEETTIDA